MTAPAGMGLRSVRPTPPAAMAARSADCIDSAPVSVDGVRGTSSHSTLPEPEFRTTYICCYRVTLVVVHLGWVDLGLRCSTLLHEQWVASVVAH